MALAVELLSSPSQSDAPAADLSEAMWRLADGDRAQANVVFSLLWPKLKRFCEHALGTADGEDAAQRALMKLFAEISDFDRERSPLAWAYAIAAWECRTVRRKRQRAREVDDDQLMQLPSPGALEHDALERDLVERALQLVATLPEQDQQTLHADLYEQLTGTSAATHRQRRKRMLTRLREAWGKTYGA